MEIPVDPGRPIKHVSRKAIYTRLEARIEYLRDFLNFNADDVEALESGQKYIRAMIPSIVNLIYRKLLEQDITARAFIVRSTADEQPIEEFFSENSPQINRRKMFLRWYLTKVCSDPTQMEFWRYLNKVGMMHSGQERLHELNIEYVHVGACLGYIQDVFTEALMSHPQLSIQRKTALLRAVNKIIWIQNDLFAKWRVRDGEEFAEEMSGGYLGEKSSLLGDGNTPYCSTDDGQSSIHTDHRVFAAHPAAASASVCPFSGVSHGGTETKIWAD